MASAETKAPGIADILAAADASHTGAGNAALVAPATPDAQVAFAAPEAFNGRFGGATDAPQPAAFSGEAKAPAEALSQPAPTSIALASAPLRRHRSLPARDRRSTPPRLAKAAAGRAIGDAAAAFEIATRYADGDRVAKDLAKAAEWYQRAAEGGVAVAQYRLGSLYERGQGVAKDLTKAVNWYQRAADQGNVNAMHNLAVLMSEGVDGSPDHDKALQWFLAAANYGVRDSQYNLGVIYARGLGTRAGPRRIVQVVRDRRRRRATPTPPPAATRSPRCFPATISPRRGPRSRPGTSKPPLAEANAVSAPGRRLGRPRRHHSARPTGRRWSRRSRRCSPSRATTPARPTASPAPKTREAVRAYQRQNGIAETGQIDTTLIDGAGRPARLIRSSADRSRAVRQPFLRDCR